MTNVLVGPAPPAWVSTLLRTCRSIARIVALAVSETAREALGATGPAYVPLTIACWCTASVVGISVLALTRRGPLLLSRFAVCSPVVFGAVPDVLTKFIVFSKSATAARYLMT